jgi:soluble cytochrome b562
MFQMGLAPKGAPPHRSADDAKPLEGAPIVAVAADDAKEKANIEATKKGGEAFNAHKGADLIAMMADDVVETDVAAPKDLKGKKEVEKGLKDFQTAFSDAKVTPDHDMGAMKKTGKKVSVPYAEIFEYKAGKVSHIWRFHDSMTMAMQLGLMPPMGAAPTGEAPKGDAPKGNAPKGDAPKGDAPKGDKTAPKTPKK